MKIGIVTTWFERGAAYVSKQYLNLLEENHEVFIYARGGEGYAKGDPNWDSPNVTWGKKPLLQTNLTPIRRADLERWVRRNGIELVIFNEQRWWPPVIWLKELGVIVGTYVDYYTEETVPLFESFDFLLCNTARHLSAFDWHPQAHYVPWGTDVNLFKPGDKSTADADKLVFFNSSGYSPDRKGADVLIKAFARLTAPDVKLLIHSQVDLRKFYPDLGDEIDRLVKGERLEVVEESVSAPGLYHRGDVYCYLSKLDGIGLTLAEAISCGLPAITPDQPPMNEFVVDGVNGALVKVKRRFCRWDGYYWPQCEVEEEDLARKLQSFVDRRQEMGALKARARDYALEHLDWSRRGKQLDEVVQLAAARPLHSSLADRIRRYEFSHSLLLPLVRAPYRMLKNLRR